MTTLLISEIVCFCLFLVSSAFSALAIHYNWTHIKWLWLSLSVILCITASTLSFLIAFK